MPNHSQFSQRFIYPTDAVGSLDHTSPLSISLASSEGLSEIKNLALVVQSGGGGGHPLHSYNYELDSNLPTPTSVPLPPLPLDNNSALSVGAGPMTIASTSSRPPLPHSSGMDPMPGPSQRLWMYALCTLGILPDFVPGGKAKKELVFYCLLIYWIDYYVEIKHGKSRWNSIGKRIPLTMMQLFVTSIYVATS